MDDDKRKENIKILKKVFDKEIPKQIEKSIYNFSVNYAEEQETPFLLEQIYDDKFNEIMSHITDKKSSLVKSIKDGIIDPKKIASLQPHQLNPEKYEKIIKKKELEEYNKNNKASSDAFKCSKCKKKKCQVRTEQRRAGDEPPTIVITCTECGHVTTMN